MKLSCKKQAISSSKAMSTIAIIIILLVLIVVAASVSAYYYFAVVNHPSTPLILYTADAYVSEANVLESGFTNSTGIQMAPPKAGGSLLLAEEISQGNPVSVFMSVSKQAVQDQYLNSESSGWAVSFATDEMAIAYSNSTLQNSAAANVVNAYNTAISRNSTAAWYDFYSNLTSGSVKVGISNPAADPAGLRAWLVLEAAGYLYAGNNTGYFANRMMTSAGNITGASAADLVAPLESGAIQFLFIYLSSTNALKLNALKLPNAVNLGDVSLSSFYSRFSYTIPSGTVQGAPITLWLTVPKDSTDFTDSVKFVVFVIENSQSILKQFGLTYLMPAKIYNDSDSVPTPIEQLVTQGTATYGGKL